MLRLAWRSNFTRLISDSNLEMLSSLEAARLLVVVVEEFVILSLVVLLLPLSFRDSRLLFNFDVFALLDLKALLLLC